MWWNLTFQGTDFPPEFYIEGFNDQLEVISETKLLGLILSNYLKWNAILNISVKKGIKRCGS